MSVFWAAIASGALRGREPERKGWKITLRDPSLPHQVVIGSVPGAPHRLYVSCNCRARPSRRIPGGLPNYEPLAVAGRFEPHQPMEIWRQHMTQVGAA